MKRVYQSLFLLMSAAAMGQANFFDVPSADTIAAGKLYFQQQASLAGDETQLSTIATFGLGKGFEAGLNLHQMTLDHNDLHLVTDGADPARQPDLMFNAQKIFNRTSWHRIGLGARVGLNYSDEMKSGSLTSFYYLNNRFSVSHTKFALTAGAWYGNRNYTGGGNDWGIMAGLQAPLLGEFLLMQADFISGKNALSYFNAGLNMWLFGWRLSGGVGLPLPESGNSFHWLLQLSSH